MASESDMEPTQTQSQSADIDENGEAQPERKESWGMLVSIHRAVKSFDLIESSFTAGRESNSTCHFNKSMGKLSLQVSKQHFKLSKDIGDKANPVYIEDLSRNGTYVNECIIGTGKKRILKHNDVICVAHPNYKLFMFKSLQLSSHTLPDEITEKYHISRVLGSGACGTVFLVYDYRTCEKFALKQIKKQQMNDYKKDRAKNEGNIMQSIKHPCVVKMLDVYDIEDSIYILLEYMEGGDLLSRILLDTFLPENISKLFFYQMCHAIKHLHSRNIAHRDLKPDNILLASSDTETLLKISDFGLSKSLQNNSVLRTMCGTPHYVAPEVLLTQDLGQYTLQVDIWSLGVVLYTCLSGTLPFSNDYGTPVTEQIKKGDFKFRSRNWLHVSATAQKLVKQLLTVDANQRPSIDQLLKHEWFDDYDMKIKAHKIMNIAPPLPRRHNFVVPYKVEEIKPANDENAQPIKKRRII